MQSDKAAVQEVWMWLRKPDYWHNAIVQNDIDTLTEQITTPKITINYMQFYKARYCNYTDKVNNG